MGKNKLRKFSEMENFKCVLQYPRERLLSEGFPFLGHWNKSVFSSDQPIVLELGCGKGEYSVALGMSNPQYNFIGIDVKGARMWSGAREVEQKNISNVKFLRAEIENIDKFFSRGEVSEIWITFPDPQMQKQRKRLTSSRFIKMYSKIMKEGGILHLKTDSPFLFEYTRRLARENEFEIIRETSDLYNSELADSQTSIKTYYEEQWLSRGKKIKLISFIVPEKENIIEPQTDDIEKDDYRAYPRHTVVSSHQK